MSIKSFFGVLQVTLIQAANHIFTELDFSKALQLIAGNNMGKTSAIRALNFLFVDDLRNCKNFDGKNWAATLKHYLNRKPTSTSWIAFALRTPTRGEFTVAVTKGERDGTVTRYVIDHPYDPRMFSECITHVNGSEERWFKTPDEMMRYLVEDLGLSKQQILKVESVREWRELLAGTHTSQRGLGIIPLISKSEETYYTFRDLMGRVLDAKSHKLNSINDALIDCAKIAEANRVLDFSKNASVKQAISDSIILIKHAEAAEAAEGQIYLLRDTVASMMESRAKLFETADINSAEIHIRLNRLQTSINERDEEIKIIKAQIESFKKQHLDKSKEREGAHKKIGALEESLKQREKERVALLDEIASLMDNRTLEEINLALEQHHGRLAMMRHFGDRRSIEQEILNAKSRLRSIQTELSAIKQNQETLLGYALRAHGEKAAATLMNALSQEILSKPASEVLSNESLLQKISLAGIGDKIDIGLIRVAVPENTRVNKGRTLEELQEEDRTTRERITKLNQALADIAAAESITAEIARLKGLQSLREREKTVNSAQYLEETSVLLEELSRAREQAAVIEAQMDELAQAMEQTQIQLRAHENRNQETEKRSLQSLAKLCEDIRDGQQSVVINTIAPIDRKLSNEEFSEALRADLEILSKESADLEKKARGIYQNPSKVIPNLIEHHLRQNSNIQFMEYFAPGEQLMEAMLESVKNAASKKSMAIKVIKNAITGQANIAYQFLNAIKQIRGVVNEINKAFEKTSFSGLKKIEINLQHDESKEKFIREFIERSSSADSLFDASDKISESDEINFFVKALENTHQYRLEEMFALSIHVVDHLGMATTASATKDVGSNGTNFMAQVIVNIKLIHTLLDPKMAKQFQLPIYVDEALQIDEGNRRVLRKFFEDHGFTTVFAHPDTRLMAMDLPFRAYQLRQGTGQAVQWVLSSFSDFSSTGPKPIDVVDEVEYRNRLAQEALERQMDEEAALSSSCTDEVQE